MELSATAKVILGMLAGSPKSGYDIKSIVDVSTRFFWAASYGQIYPDLKRLEEAGLIQGVADPQGGRQRTVYSLTEAGREALHEWLSSGGEPPFEMRDEGLLKFFFAGSLSGDERLELLRQIRERHEKVVERLEQIEPTATQAGGFPALTLKYGIAHHRWMADWARAMETEVLETAEEA
jgi:DNA-binding PadR family transcriptional regulator